MKEETIKKQLSILGLTKYQSNVYLTLIKEGSMIAKDIAKKSNVPQPKIYGTLDELENLGLIEVLPDFPKKYKATSPISALLPLIENKKEELIEIEKNTNIIITDLEGEYGKKQLKPNEYVWVVPKGRKEYLNRIVEFINKSEEEIVLMTVNLSIYPGFKKALKTAIKRGVKVKVIGHLTPETKEAAKIYEEIGCEVRSIKHNAPRFAIFDNKKTAVRIGEFYINLIIDNKPFTDIFNQFFNSLWKKAKKA